MISVCAQCGTVIKLRTDSRKIRVLPSGKVVCDRCFFSRGKKESGSNSHGFEGYTLPPRGMLNNRAQVLIHGGSSKCLPTILMKVTLQHEGIFEQNEHNYEQL